MGAATFNSCPFLVKPKRVTQQWSLLELKKNAIFYEITTFFNLWRRPPVKKILIWKNIKVPYDFHSQTNYVCTVNSAKYHVPSAKNRIFSTVFRPWSSNACYGNSSLKFILFVGGWYFLYHSSRKNTFKFWRWSIC